MDRYLFSALPMVALLAVCEAVTAATLFALNRFRLLGVDRLVGEFGLATYGAMVPAVVIVVLVLFVLARALGASGPAADRYEAARRRES